jgi:hypothetical protein
MSRVVMILICRADKDIRSEEPDGIGVERRTEEVVEGT